MSFNITVAFSNALIYENRCIFLSETEKINLRIMSLLPMLISIFWVMASASHRMSVALL